MMFLKQRFCFHSRREFYTSGLIRSVAEGDMIWESDGSRVAPDIQYWLTDDDKHSAGQYITYKYGGTRTKASRSIVGLLSYTREE
jgi:hypothetical protein